MRYKGQAAVQKDIAIFKAALKGVDVAGGFLPVVAPASAVPFSKNEYYKSDEEFLFALGDALHEEYAAIVNAGLMVQVDDAFLPYMYDVAFGGEDLASFRKWAEVRIEAVNRALKGIPEEKVRYHICWGSFNTPHTSDIPLKDIVDLVLKVKAGAYCIEMGNPRHEHEWRVWENGETCRRGACWSPASSAIRPTWSSIPSSWPSGSCASPSWLGARTSWAAPIAALRNRRT